ncbi:hypothetical protein FB446DRAFT_794550 [Lentinula raphanica]|nr:hypothetical protein FB446DRAFT_794550 [Lentinula raphanica]
MSIQCQGCGTPFVGSNLLRHLRNTRHPGCLLYLDRLLHPSFEQTPSDDEQAQPGPAMFVDRFQGEPFGGMDGSDDDNESMEIESPGSESQTVDTDTDSDSMSSDGSSEQNDWEPPLIAVAEHARSPSPELLFPEGFFDEPLQLPKPSVTGYSKAFVKNTDKLSGTYCK